MSIVVVGSVAFDTLTTPKEHRARIQGGAAYHFAQSARFFTDVRVIGVVGNDFTAEHEAMMTSRGIDTTGVEHADGLSFHWTGEYKGAMNEAITLNTELNVFGSFDPKVPKQYKDSKFLFLANIEPTLQLRVRQQFPDAKLVAGDTMNYWIADHKANLLKTIAELDVLVINDGEARLLTGEHNLVTAAKKVMEMGPKSLVIKHGEYGATAFFCDRSFPGAINTVPFRAPALPIEEVVDPTGAGDMFAGGFFGYIASQPELTPRVFRTALFYGGVMGSFAVEKFGSERVQELTREEIEERFKLFREISHLDLDAA
jgi:sugar/nucleoside kinase (ribokinase family)